MIKKREEGKSILNTGLFKNTSKVLIFRIIIENKVTKESITKDTNIFVDKSSIDKLKDIHKKMFCPEEESKYNIHYCYKQ